MISARMLAAATMIVSGQADGICPIVTEKEFAIVIPIWAAIVFIIMLLVAAIALQLVVLRRQEQKEDVQSVAEVPLSLAARSKGTQSQCTYRRDLAQPRFQYMGDSVIR